MQTHPFSTPFGRRQATLGQFAMQMQTRRAIEAATPGSNAPAAVNKWQLFRTLTEIRARLGISDRTLGLLNALLSFHPETALVLPKREEADSGEGAYGPCDLVVFPSNRQLGLRAHGMAEKTLRNHLAALVAAGLIIRRDSPNGKRYARKAEAGGDRHADAFGFDLTPLVARAAEFEALAEEERQGRRRLQLMRERISLFRRDAAKLIALGLEEGAPGPWEGFRLRYLGLLTPLRRLGGLEEATALEAALSTLRDEVAKALEDQLDVMKNTGNDGFNNRHQSNSNTNPHTDLEPASKEEGEGLAGMATEPGSGSGERGETAPLHLGLVLEACPDVVDYARDGEVKSWSAFLDAVRTIRPMIGISPDAWREALEALGEVPAHVAVAAILQRSVHSSEARAGSGPDGATMTVNGSPAIQSPGGYLRALVDKAGEGRFSIGPLLMALIGQRLKVRRASGR